MKQIKTLVALILALTMIMSITSAFAAVNITINRDSTTYEDGGTEESGKRSYTYKQIFRATENANHTSTGGGYDTDGTPGSVTTSPEKGISYYLNSTDTTQIGQLGTWENGTWTKKTGNDWFKLTKSADGSRYIVEWDNTKSDTDTVQAAAKWLDANYTALSSGNLTAAADGKSWTASDLPEGYYLLKGETGENLIAATADITVNEKNSYPTIDKKQKETETGTYADANINVKVGDTIYYQVEVKVPADANADIVVTDTMSAGLTYDTTANPAVKVGDTALTADVDETTKKDYVIGAKTPQSWVVTIHPTDATKGKTVVITFAATVNNDALVKTARKNDVELTYGNYHQKDSVEHDIGAAAIIKYDGATADLNSSTNALVASGATAIKYLEASFTLTDASGNAIKVKEATSGTKGVYVVDTTATSNTVTSDKNHNGVILIYGLDPDVTYTLTETATEDGYNLLNGTVSITPTKLDTSNVNATKVTVAEASGISAGDSNAAAENSFELNAKQVNKIENNQGSVLPSTGGIGTTIFYIAGAVLVLGAAAIVIARRKAEQR